MEQPQIQNVEPIAESARALLERYAYGNDDVTAILRFAEAHKLSKDNTVWLMTAILKVNNNLVMELLRAIAMTERTLAGAKTFRQNQDAQYKELTDRLVKQVNIAATEGAATLDLSIARLENVIAKLDDFAASLRTAADDYKSTTNLLQANDLDNPASLLGSIRREMISDARFDAHRFVEQAFQRIDFTKNPVPEALYWITGFNAVMCLMLAMAMLIG